MKPRVEKSFGPYVAPSESSRADMEKLGIERPAQDRVYSALAKGAEKLAAAQQWSKDLEFRPIAVGPGID